MNKKPDFYWNPEEKTATCTIYDGNKTYVGIAKCQDVDADMCSEKTGYEIAFFRARIKLYIANREELKIRLSALKYYFNSINQSKKYNEKSYEVKILKKQMKIIELDIALMENMINEEKQQLKTYIDLKDAFYKKIRSNRAQRSN